MGLESSWKKLELYIPEGNWTSSSTLGVVELIGGGKREFVERTRFREGKFCLNTPKKSFSVPKQNNSG